MTFDYSTFRFGTKAETLEKLKPLLSLCQIPELFYFTVDEWKRGRERILGEIISRFLNQTVIVRSSAVSEDGGKATMAGAHMSIPDVHSADRTLLNDSINEVIGSYNRKGCIINTNDQVLIQTMIKDVSMSGVVFTQDMNTGAPYYVINYDDQSGRTDTITSGAQNSNKTLMVHRDAARDLRSPRFKALILAIQEIEDITGHDSLDIEYAVGENHQVFLFQARTITTHINWNRGITLRANDAIKRIRSFVSKRFAPLPGIYGKRSVFGKMPDWNPAEMIGVAPRPLALSLYRRLITDFAWRVARKNMGYAAPMGAPLMVSLCGQPYIDVRLSLHSFLPEELTPSICHKLVDAWLDRLSENKELHDKIEFEVAITALDFNFQNTVQEQLGGILETWEIAEFKKSLHYLTSRLLTGKVASIEEELQKIGQIEKQRRQLFKNSSPPDLLMVTALLEDCIWFGTIPFSITARHAFIARSLLLSLVKKEILDEKDAMSFLASIRTIAGEMVEDFERLSSGGISRDKFTP